MRKVRHGTQRLMTHQVHGQRTHEHRTDAEADGHENDVRGNSERSENAVERERRIERFEVNEAGEARGTCEPFMPIPAATALSNDTVVSIAIKMATVASAARPPYTAAAVNPAALAASGHRKTLSHSAIVPSACIQGAQL
jgi:hypothetical protein